MKLRGLATIGESDDSIEFMLDDVTSSVNETLDDTALRAARAALFVTDVERVGVSNVTFSVEYTVTGTLEFDAREWGDETPLEDLCGTETGYELRDVFEDTIRGAARDAVSAGDYSDMDIEVDNVEFEEE